MSYSEPTADNCEPKPYRPARDMAPAGTVNTSRPESGGQLNPPGDVNETPSMQTATRGTKPGAGNWGGPTGATAGDPPAD